MTTTQGGEVTEDTCITEIPLSGADVNYTYTVTNESAVPVVNAVVMDDVFGEVPGSPIPSLEPGESVTLRLTVFLSEETTNTVTVFAYVGDVECTAAATATVTVGLPGDCDADDDVDLVDLQHLTVCLSGPGGGLLSDCGCADLDGDLDVDLVDFAMFQLVFTGSP
jgi:hypothetical protein